MPLPSSGAISLNQMHTELGSPSGSQVSINDSDVRGLIGKSSGAQMSFSEWYGASAITEVSHDMFGSPVTSYFAGIKGSAASTQMAVRTAPAAGVSSFGPTLSVAQAQTALGLPTNQGIYSIQNPVLTLFGDGSLTHNFEAMSTGQYGNHVTEGADSPTIPTSLLNIRIRFGKSSSYSGGDITILRSQMTMQHTWVSATGSSPYSNNYTLVPSPTYTSVANFVNSYAASPTYQSQYIKLTYTFNE